MRIVWIMGLTALVAVIGGVVTKPQPACAALPPLSSEALEQNSKYIVVGIVMNVSSEEVTINIGTNHKYTAIVTVEEVQENSVPQTLGADLSSASPPVVGEEIKVNYWRVGRRPDGWVGPAGQSSSLDEGATVRLYLTQDLNGCFNLLEPNGWQLITE